jgi:hypothetical protein
VAVKEEIRLVSPVQDSILAVYSPEEQIVGGSTTTGYQTAPRGGFESSQSDRSDSVPSQQAYQTRCPNNSGLCIFAKNC